jgi:tetratricopeptide (TPR) repeat protein
MLTDAEIAALGELEQEAHGAAQRGQFSEAIDKIDVVARRLMEAGITSPIPQVTATRAEWRRQANDRAGSIADFRLAADGFRGALIGDLSHEDRQTRAQLRQVLGNLADLLRDDGLDAEALPAYQEMADLARSLGELHWQQRALNNVAGIQHRAGRYREALDTYKAQGDLARRIDEPLDLVRSLSNQVVILHQHLEDTSAAMGLLEELEAAASRTGIINVEMQIRGIVQRVREEAAANEPGAPRDPLAEARALAAKGDSSSAIRICREYAQACQQDADPARFRRALELTGELLLHTKNYSDAAPVFGELHEIALQQGDVDAAMHYMGQQVAAMDAATSR